jgi:membrane protease YdiL (CAAX protease family)
MRVLVFLMLLGLLWLPFLGLTQALVRDANQASIISLIILYVAFIGLVHVWSDRLYQVPRPLRRYGLSFSPQSGRELMIGFGLGAFSLGLLFMVQGVLGWLQWQPLTGHMAVIALEGLLSALGIGFAEELFFRGWLLDELQRDYRPSVALWLNASLFAIAHLRLLQLPSLLVLGAMLVWAKWSRGCPSQGQIRHRLALPIGLHSGLVWGYYLVNVGQLVTYTGRVPAWVTGVDQNPLIGVMGFIFLSLLAIALQRYSRKQNLQLSTNLANLRS